MPSGPRRDPYLDRLRAIQAETAGIDACLDALESGYTLDAERVDSIVRSQMLARPVRYEDFLSEGKLEEIALEYSQALNKGVDCDALDYALSAACGLVSGIVDVIFVGTPGEGLAGNATDNLFDAVVVRFAKSLKDDNGNPLWNPKPGNENNVASAIGRLEQVFKVGYDQVKSADTAGVIKNMLPKNHHAKSASHYPDFIGLIASICNQFTDTSTFFDSNNGQIAIVPGTGNGVELIGKTLTAKVFAGTINWFGHCMSDVAGSSGASGRGTGLPLPFWEFFELCNFGKFPNEKGQWQSFATVMTQVYEQGYDLRHGVSTTFPVLINELLVRAVYTIKRHFGAGVPWSECLPVGKCPELQRMLTVGVGSMCLIDLGHAAATSWGNWVKFFGELNITAWARFGLQGARELQAIAERDTRNLLELNDDISSEWNRLLERSQSLLE